MARIADRAPDDRGVRPDQHRITDVHRMTGRPRHARRDIRMMDHAHTGQPGDGHVLVMAVSECYAVRTRWLEVA